MIKIHSVYELINLIRLSQRVVVISAPYIYVVATLKIIVYSLLLMKLLTISTLSQQNSMNAIMLDVIILF